MSVEQCGVCDDVPEIACPRPAAYFARWDNGDEQLLCVEHAAWVRVNSSDLATMASADRPSGDSAQEADQ